VYNGEVVKSATVEAFPGDAIPAMPEELNCDFVTLTLEGTMPASVSDDHVLSYNVQWNGPFQFSTTEADATAAFMLPVPPAVDETEEQGA
jgi:hypothetical protein